MLGAWGGKVFYLESVWRHRNHCGSPLGIKELTGAISLPLFPLNFLTPPSPICSWPETIQGNAAGLAVCKQCLWWSAPLQMILAPERGKDNHTHLSDRGLSSGLEADNWSICRPHPPMKSTQGTTQGKCPAVWCYCILGKHLV